MKNLNEKSKYINAKTKSYYGGVALVALMSTFSPSQAMEVEVDTKLSVVSKTKKSEENNTDEKFRIRCSWNLGTKGSRSAALEIMEKKVLDGPFQEDPKWRIKYLKKLGEFLKEYPKDYKLQ